MTTRYLICPVCQQDLTAIGKHWCCAAGHHFDEARQGYLNLLLPQQKKSKQPGDNAEMILARQTFLNQGYYQPVSDTLNQLAVEHLFNLPQPHVLDLGCGEGYYTERLQLALNDHQIDAQVYGIDISKPAVMAACKRSKDIHWLVGTNAHPPVGKGKTQLIVSIFTRIMEQQLRELIADEGYLVTVNAGSHHLSELKEIIYQHPKYEEFDVKSRLQGHFQHQHRTTLDYPICVKGAALRALLDMTPHTWRANTETKAKLYALEQLNLRVHMHVDWFKPC
jgi:23S rRNA (guanine745-N1)-methyltransferase